MNFERKALQAWLDECIFANTTFHETRKNLWEKLSASKTTTDDDAKISIQLSLPLILKLKNYLTSRSEDLKEPAKLAFSAALAQVASVLKPRTAQSLADLDLSRVEEHKEEQEPADV